MSENKFPGEPPASLRHKERGSSTLKQCGWCSYVSNGSCRYSYSISGNCELLSRFGSDSRAEVRWDTVCKLLDWGKLDLEYLVKCHERQGKELRESADEEDENASIIGKDLIPTALDIPILPTNRNYDHFDIDDKVMVYFWKEDCWFDGVVVSGYRSQDGCVSYYLDRPDEDEEDNCGGAGMRRPEVLLKSEADWLKQHSVECKVWFQKGFEDNLNGETYDPIAPSNALIQLAKELDK